MTGTLKVIGTDRAPETNRMTHKITINRDLLRNAERHARATYPEECCGFLFGKRNNGSSEVILTERVNNLKAENRQRRYLITPEQFMEAEGTADRTGYELIGVYHSHPDHPAIPSQFDLDHALPGFLYLITSVRRKTETDSRWWELLPDRGAFQELNIGTNSKEN